MSKENMPEVKKGLSAVVAKLDNISFATYDRVLFQNLSLNVNRGDVIAVTGRSGAGKTLLLKMIAGIEHPQEGKVDISPSIVTSFVPQEIEDIDIDQKTTIRQLLKDSRGLSQIEEEMKKTETDMSNPLVGSQSDIEKYGSLMDRYFALNGYDQESEMQGLLLGLKIDELSTGNITLDTKLSEMSSGQLKKVMIARALFTNPDLLLLDDPTSHLDILAVSWLANYFSTTTSAVVIASNNQEFLDMCASRSVGLTDSGRVFSFDGSYSDFVAKRDVVIKAEKSEANSIEDQIEGLQETDRMFRAKQAYKKSSSMAQVGRALRTRITKLEEKYKIMPGSQDAYDQNRTKDMVFAQEARSGEDVISIKKAVKRYGNYIALDFTACEPIYITRGEKLLVWGPNGSGKSTLLRMIAQKALGGYFVPDEGSIMIGTNISCAYYSPDFANISRTGSILDEVTREAGIDDGRKAASILRFFGFTPSAVLNLDVSMLSSGEKKRLALAKIMLRNHNLLILDEPTGDYMPNEIKERLANALNGYSGTLVLSTHDTYFLRKLRVDFRLNMPEGKVS